MKTHPVGLAVVLALVSYGVAQYQAPAPDTSSSQSSTSNQSKSADATTQVDDQALNTKLHEQFNTDSALKNVQIKVSNGVVDLTGSVPSKDDRRRAKEMAQAVPGVRSVREKISVAAASGPGAAMSAPGHTATSETAHNTAGSIAGNSETTSASTAGQTGAASEASGSATQGAQSGGVTGSTNATGSTTDKTGSTANTGPAGAPIAGSSGQSSTTMQGQSSGIASPADDSSSLRSELDSAFQSEPTLSNSHITVNVTESTIELTGSVPTAKEHQTATRIAQSYAGNRKVSDKITVGGSPGDGNSSNSGPGSDMSGGTNTRTTGTTPATKDPSMTPPATDNQQTAPPAQNPKTQSDQNSASPR